MQALGMINQLAFNICLDGLVDVVQICDYGLDFQ